MPLLGGVNEHADLCRGESLCGACKDICPVGNDLPRMLSELRHMLAYGDAGWGVRPVGRMEALGFQAWAAGMSSRRAYDALLAAGRLAQRPFLEDGVLRRGIGPLGAWTGTRDLPPIAAEGFARRWRDEHAPRLAGAKGADPNAEEGEGGDG